MVRVPGMTSAAEHDTPESGPLRDAWNPAQYEKFAAERAQPFWDLAALVEDRPLERAVDLGCGTGVLAVLLARANDGLTVTATDESAAAVASARATVAANGLEGRVVVVRADGAGALEDDSVDLVLLNPPFHVGAAVHSGVAQTLFEDAARVLRPGGELWAVWNSHLRYRPTLERVVGPTWQAGRDPKFTVTVSTRRAPTP